MHILPIVHIVHLYIVSCSSESPSSLRRRSESPQWKSQWMGRHNVQYEEYACSVHMLHIMYTLHILHIQQFTWNLSPVHMTPFSRSHGTFLPFTWNLSPVHMAPFSICNMRNMFYTICTIYNIRNLHDEVMRCILCIFCIFCIFCISNVVYFVKYFWPKKICYVH